MILNIGEFDHIAPTSIVWSFCGKIVLLELLPWGLVTEAPTNRPVVALGGPWVHVKKKGKRQLVGDLVATHICDICGF